MSERFLKLFELNQLLAQVNQERDISKRSLKSEFKLYNRTSKTRLSLTLSPHAAASTDVNAQAQE
jgi:hypothetical protein